MFLHIAAIHLLFNRSPLCNSPSFSAEDAKRVIVTLLPFLLLSASAAFPPQGMPGAFRGNPGASVVEMAQMTIEQRVIIRVPMMRQAMPAVPDDREARYRADPRPQLPPPPPRIEWEEHKGPKCIRISELRSAAITSGRGVDLMLDDRSRMRALLGRECRPVDLYSGFYIQPHADGSLCAGRDRVLARSGADCAITDLKRLKPKH